MFVYSSVKVRMVLNRTLLNNGVKKNVQKLVCYSVSSYGNVRVRFAPSPTGFLHLGGLRTALYNYLFAKSKGGTFILRIEDTDQTRIVPGALQKLEEDLAWTGIIPDEGPSAGGKYGPYIQSERADLYRTEVQKLIQNETAYYCFCTERRLELLRCEAVRAGQVPKYDNRCRHLSKADVDKKLNEGAKKCIRFKLTQGAEQFHDLVCGTVAHDVASVEGDPIILKSDRLPTYHLANVIDDHYMEISHVLRGIEWQPSTAKHILMYKAFGWDPPEYAHLPLLMNADGTKLSKRQGDITVNFYRESGILPRALINFVTYSGGGFRRGEKHEGFEIKSYSMDELCHMFDLNLVSGTSCKVALNRLNDFNQVEMCQQISDTDELQRLVTELKVLIQDKFKDRLDTSLDLSEDHIKSVLLWSQKRISRLSDLVGEKLAFLWLRPNLDHLNIQTPDVFVDLIMLLSGAEEFKKESLAKLLRNFANNHNVPFKNFMKDMRFILSGLKDGPSVAEMLEILGKKTSLARIERATEYFKQQTEKHMDSN